MGCRGWQHQQSYSPQSLKLANWNKLRIRTGSWCIPSMAFKSGDGDKKAHATNEAQLIFPHAGMKSVCFGNDDDYFLCGISKNNLREVAKKFKRDSFAFCFYIDINSQIKLFPDDTLCCECSYDWSEPTTSNIT